MPQFADQFPNIRDHILHKRRNKISWRGSAQTAEQKRLKTKQRKEEIKLDVQKQNFFNWIELIQQKLELSDIRFAHRLQVTKQTIQLWKRRAGHYPSQRSYLLLCKLEREANLTIKDFKVTYGIRS